MRDKTIVVLVLLSGCASDVETGQLANAQNATVELKAAKLLVEHNATDEDTGFQGFVDHDPWNQLDIRDAGGKTVVSISAEHALKPFGLTELFFETNEPENAEIPITEILAVLPEGDYEIAARTVEGELAVGTARLSHAIPAGAVITAPARDAEVCADEDLELRWNAVTESVFGDPVTITHYQLIVSKADQPSSPGFGSETLSVHVPASITSMRVPHEFLQPGTDYELEILAIEAGGAQTISSGEFSTE